MPLISGVDNEVQATHKQDIEKSKDESKFKICATKPPAYQSQSVPVPKATEMHEGMPLPITIYVPPNYVPQGTSVGSDSTSLLVEQIL